MCMEYSFPTGYILYTIFVKYTSIFLIFLIFSLLHNNFEVNFGFFIISNKDYYNFPFDIMSFICYNVNCNIIMYQGELWRFLRI